jgi:hypothetical protein
MNAYAEIARLREERDDALKQARHMTEVIAEMGGHNEEYLPGFKWSDSRILRCLMAANGRVVSFGGLMQALYFDRAEDWPESRVVAVYICRIRTEHPDIGARIINVRGFGYKLVPVVVARTDRFEFTEPDKQFGGRDG